MGLAENIQVNVCEYLYAWNKPFIHQKPLSPFTSMKRYQWNSLVSTVMFSTNFSVAVGDNFDNPKPPKVIAFTCLTSQHPGSLFSENPTIGGAVILRGSLSLSLIVNVHTAESLVELEEPLVNISANNTKYFLDQVACWGLDPYTRLERLLLPTH